MLSLLIKKFIKNPENVSDNRVREQYGVVCGGYGVFLNILLFAGKYFAGMLSGSIAMTADAFNNLSDAGSSIISVIGFKLAGQKPDPEHPFGHGRFEYITGLAVACTIVIMGYELLKQSFSKILHPEELSFSIVSVIIMGVAIMIKFYMAYYSKKIGKKINSEAILAVSTDSLSDTVSTAVVLIATIIHGIFDIHLDGWCGLLVGVLIIIAGVKAAKETIGPLLGQPPSKEFVDSVEKIVMSFDEIVGIHDLIVHDYGPGRIMISLHAEVPGTGNINELHDVIDNAEVLLAKELNCHAVIHMDPVEVGNEETDRLKELTKETVKEIDERLSIHDFRVVTGPTHTNLIFDVVAPYKLKFTDNELKGEIGKAISAKDRKLRCVMHIDRDFVSVIK